MLKCIITNRSNAIGFAVIGYGRWDNDISRIIATISYLCCFVVVEVVVDAVDFGVVGECNCRDEQCDERE